MEEIQIISKYKDTEILAQILDGKFAVITDDNRSKNDGRREDAWESDNDEYIFAIYKVLKEVDKKGGFDHLQEGEDLEDKNVEKIYV